jgi:membrane protein implicated in regulation of membrane protease activity
MPEASILEWAVQQGGMTMVAVLALWFYRQLANRVSQQQDQQIHTLMDVVKDTTIAIQQSIAASNATRESVDRLSRMIETQQMNLGRREGDAR